MQYRRLGRSGLTVSVVGLGCNNLGRPGTATLEQDGTDAVVHAAQDAGVTSTADAGHSQVSARPRPSGPRSGSVGSRYSWRPCTTLPK